MTTQPTPSPDAAATQPTPSALSLPPCSPPAAAPTAAAALQSPAMPALPPILDAMPRPVKSALFLQAQPAATPYAVTPALSASVAAVLPPAIVAQLPEQPEHATADNRAWLTSAPAVSPRSGRTGKQYTLDFGPPPDALHAVEGFLWPELGVACARALVWLAELLKCRRYTQACDNAGLLPYDIQAYRIASPRFTALYTAVDTIVRTTRHARNEDTLDALANGEAKRTKQALTLEGNVVTLTETLPPDVKALQLALAREDPAYRQAGAPVAAGGNVAINITFGGVRRFLGKPSDGGDIVDAEVVQPADSNMLARLQHTIRHMS